MKRNNTIAVKAHGRLEIVPLDPDFVPSEEAIALALKELKHLLPKGECHSWTSDYVQVVGLFRPSNQPIVCPCCKKKYALSAHEVFGLGEMLFVQPATDIELSMPCCDSEVVLAAIDFGPYVRFARFGLKVHHRRNRVSDKTIKALEAILGGPLTQVKIKE